MQRFAVRSLTSKDQSGFTLVELLIALTIMLVVFALSTINLGQSQSNVGSSANVDTILSDLRNQQLLSMAGDIGSASSAQPHGIYVQATKYTLFTSSTYSASDTRNFDVASGTNVTLSTTLPSSQVVFNKGDGSVNGFTAGSNTITVTAAGRSRVITINRFGATTLN